jgi:hypothetical protein
VVEVPLATEVYLGTHRVNDYFFRSNVYFKSAFASLYSKLLSLSK